MDAIQDAIRLIDIGEKAKARHLLAGLLLKQPDNEVAWTMMSCCVDEPDRRMMCLSQVLRINPENSDARAAIENMQAPIRVAASVAQLQTPSANKPVTTAPAINNPPTQPSARKPVGGASLQPPGAGQVQFSATQSVYAPSGQLGSSVPDGALMTPAGASVAALPPSRPIGMSDSEIIYRINNGSHDEKVAAMKAVRQYGISAAAPALLENILESRLMKEQNRIEEYSAAVMALLAIGKAGLFTQVPENRVLSFDNESAQAYYRGLMSVGRSDVAVKYLKKAIAPNTNEDKSTNVGRNLLFVLLLGETGDPEVPRLLCKQIKAEKKIWSPGISWGYFLMFSDPVSFLVTGALSLTASVAATMLDRSRFKTVGMSTEALLVTPDAVTKANFMQQQPAGKLMLVLHTYGTALAAAARINPVAVVEQLRERRHVLEQAVICWGLAFVGEASIQNSLLPLTKDSDWIVRAIAYEALIALADVRRVQAPNEVRCGLQDQDMKVVGSTANAMACTGNPVYVSSILALGREPDKELRQAVLPVIGKLALTGNAQAQSELALIASNDTDREIREMAENVTRLLKA